MHCFVNFVCFLCNELNVLLSNPDSDRDEFIRAISVIRS